MPAALPRPHQGERLFAIGNTGTGKTTLVRSLFAGVEHGICVDTKQDEEWEAYGKVVKGNNIYRVGPGRFIWRPAKNFPFDEDAQEKFFRWALDVGKRVIYIDEFADICPNANEYPRALKLCIMRGRSKRLSIWGTTQEPLRVPRFLFGQAEHRYCFFIGHPAQQRLASHLLEAPLDFSKIPMQYDAMGTPLGSPFYYRARNGIVYGPLKLTNVEPTTLRRVS